MVLGECFSEFGELGGEDEVSEGVDKADHDGAGDVAHVAAEFKHTKYELQNPTHDGGGEKVLET